MHYECFDYDNDDIIFI